MEKTWSPQILDEPRECGGGASLPQASLFTRPQNISLLVSHSPPGFKGHHAGQAYARHMGVKAAGLLPETTERPHHGALLVVPQLL